MSTIYDPAQTPPSTNELVGWCVGRLNEDADLSGYLSGPDRADGTVHSFRVPEDRTESFGVVRIRHDVGGRPATFTGSDAPPLRVEFYTWPHEPDIDKFHRACQLRAYKVLTGERPQLQSSRTIKPLTRRQRPGTPAFDDGLERWFTISTYGVVLHPS